MKLSEMDRIRLERIQDEGVVNHPASILEVRGWVRLYERGWITARHLTRGTVAVMLTDAGREVLHRRDAMRKLAGKPTRREERRENIWC